MLKTAIKASAILSLGLLSAASVNAGTVGPSCATCYGSIYSLTDLGLVNSGLLTETHRFAYTINTTGSNLDASYYIRSLALRVTSLLLSASLYSAPSNTGNWVVEPWEQVGSAGCSGFGLGWVCLNRASGPSTNRAYIGGSYTWLLNVTMLRGTMLDVADIQVNYDPPAGLYTRERVAMPEGVPVELPVAISCLGLWALGRKYLAARHRPVG
jgi:hypothetical protein